MISIMWNDSNLIKVFKNNSIAVMPTDTIYGIVGSALSKSVVERIYDIRKRAPQKPCIILIGDINELHEFSIHLSDKQKEKLEEYWSFDVTQDLRPTSIILDCNDYRFSYLHRGTKTLAFRIPLNLELRNLLKQTGPLIAPSANPEGLLPAQNIEEAKKYFAEAVSLYVDGGEITGKASKIIRLNSDGSTFTIRD